MISTEERRRQVVQGLRARYLANGYSVDTAASVEGLVPDLLATKGSETVVVEVKLATAADVRTRSLSAVAQLAQARGWRFVVALATSADVEEVEITSSSEVERRLGEISELPQDSVAFGLVAWSVFEAAARLAIARSGTPTGRATPHGVVQQLAALGLISPDEEVSLGALVRARNKLAHGFWPPDATKVDFGSLVEVSRRLIRSEEAAHP